MSMVPQLQALRPAELDVPAIVESALRYGMQRLPSEGSPSSAVGCKLLIQKKKKLPLQMAHLNEIKHLQRLVSNSGAPAHACPKSNPVRSRCEGNRATRTW